MDEFDQKDCIVERGDFPGFQMLAIAIPATTDYVSIKLILDQYERAYQLSYAELVA